MGLCEIEPYQTSSPWLSETQSKQDEVRASPGEVQGRDIAFQMNKASRQAKYHFGQHPVNNQNTEQSPKKKCRLLGLSLQRKGNTPASAFCCWWCSFCLFGLPLCRKHVAEMRMNFAIPNGPLLSPHSGLPADSCLEV